MLGSLSRDRDRYPGRWAEPGLWVVAIHRFGQWASALPNPLLRWPMWLLYRLAHLSHWPMHVHLWAGAGGARIGAGLVLIHPHNVVIGNGVEIGDDCLIFHDVTLGTGPMPGTPKIGNRVDIYVGARVLGGVTIGDGSMIGANCVVVRDIPPGSVVLAAPCKVIPRALSPVASAADRQRTVEPSSDPAAPADAPPQRAPA
jgi:serine O-acetyltransferase